MVQLGFEWYDYLLFTSTLVVSLGIGLFYAFSGGGQKTTKDYLMGGRTMKPLPVSLSMVMSYISAILVLGNTAEMYNWGSQMYMACYGSSLASLSVAIIFVPLFFPLKITSSFEYIMMRFRSHSVKYTCTFLLMTSQCLYMGIAMYSPATALDAVTGFPTWASILLTGIIGTIYTSLGGMKAVIWTDVFQSCVMVSGMIAVLVVGSMKVGGFDKVWRISAEQGRLDFDFDPNPIVRMSVWSVFIGRFVAQTQVCGTQQAAMQRYCSLPTIKDSRLSVLYNIPLNLVIYTMTWLTGLVVFAYYHQWGCDPLRTDLISSSNQLLPFFIIDVLKEKAPGLPGLFVAVLFSGALSTISSSLNSLAAVTWKDILEKRFKHLSEGRKALVNKMLVACYGALAVGIAFAVQVLGGHVLQASHSFVSGVAGPLLGIFVLGAFFPFANWIGAVVGAIVGLVFCMTLIMGSYVLQPYRRTLPTDTSMCAIYAQNISSAWNVTKDIKSDPTDVAEIFRMSYQWFAPLGTITCVAVGLLVSIITGPEKASEQDPRLIIPWVNRLFCCLPHGLRQHFYCGVDHDSVVMNHDGYYPEALEREREEEGIEVGFDDFAADIEMPKDSEPVEESPDISFRRRNYYEKQNGAYISSDDQYLASTHM